MPAYIYSSREDHIVPWRSAYLSRGSSAARPTFVLGASGHIAGVINPAAKNKRSHWRNDAAAATPKWLAGATEHKGSWWPHWIEWLKAHGGEERVPRRRSSAAGATPIEAAPGRYVKEKAEIRTSGSCGTGRSGRCHNKQSPRNDKGGEDHVESGTGNRWHGRSGRGGLHQAGALGYKVVTTYSPSNTKARTGCKQMKAQGFDFKAYPCDVADFDSCKACAEQVAKELGPVDVLVNNAGITRDMTFKKMTKGDWDVVMNTNLDSVFNMTKQVMDGMGARLGPRHQRLLGQRPEGRLRPDQLFGRQGRHARLHQGAGPGSGEEGRDGEHHQPGLHRHQDGDGDPAGSAGARSCRRSEGRLGKPEEVAGLVAYLASEEAAFVTGANISINGGQHMF
jgi:acetoacetyl-CoA reductase